jgi:hypothetical protein
LARVRARDTTRFVALGAGTLLVLLLSLFLGRYPRLYWMSPDLLWIIPLALRLLLYMGLVLAP